MTCQHVRVCLCASVFQWWGRCDIVLFIHPHNYSSGHWCVIQLWRLFYSFSWNSGRCGDWWHSLNTLWVVEQDKIKCTITDPPQKKFSNVQHNYGEEFFSSTSLSLSLSLSLFRDRVNKETNVLFNFNHWSHCSSISVPSYCIYTTSYSTTMTVDLVANTVLARRLATGGSSLCAYCWSLLFCCAPSPSSTLEDGCAGQISITWQHICKDAHCF